MTKALIVVDMINDFCHMDGSLFVKNSLETIPQIEKLIRRFGDAKLPIFYCNDAHGEKDEEFKRWPVHAVKGTWGAKLVDEIARNFISLTYRGTNVEKLRYDPFYGTSLDHLLRLEKVDTVVIVGTVANICVLACCNSACLRHYNVILPTDCISALDDEGMKILIHQATQVYNATVTTSEKIEL